MKSAKQASKKQHTPVAKKKTASSKKVVPSMKTAGVDSSYQAHDDMNTLSRAHEILSDKGRMAGVAAHHAKHAAMMQKFGKKGKM